MEYYFELINYGIMGLWGDGHDSWLCCGFLLACMIDVILITLEIPQMRIKIRPGFEENIHIWG